ncbi:MAG: histidine kinase [Spirochaetae bacterium HGW-Spirochaetae-7]|jgi:CBS domain-containing protein|nr:MAG: histidine kinase [Spirochaetae bacterium HGW-Spirochaetae-7]
METVKSILAAKGADVVSVGPDALVIEALQIMAERNVGAVLVMDAAGDIVGIFSERDFARRIIIKGRSCDVTKVREIMTNKLTYAEPGTSIADCMNIMTTNHFRHLPIKEKGKVVGVISIGDVVKALVKDQEKVISEQAFEIGQHERRSPGAV